jgi:prepilin-type N-terminal cleavage/methylation domain-containing protein
MHTNAHTNARPSAGTGGFTLAEVIVSTAILGMIFSSVIYGYILTNYRAEYSLYSLAAQSLAVQGVEQARAAKWDPNSWPPVDELGVTNYAVAEMLDIPAGGGAPIWATNYVTVSTISTSPALRELRADCVWSMGSLHGRSRGPFTNSVITLRACDQ